MIQSDYEYKNVKNMLAGFEQALTEYPAERPADMHPMTWHAQRQALESKIENLRSEIKEWEKFHTS